MQTSGSPLSGTRQFEPHIKPVMRTSISDEIVDQLMALISSGDLKPGQRLPSERDLCRKFGAGRSSLREALRCLCIVGVLNARVGEGTSVAADGGKFFGRIVEWRVITEQHDIEDMMQLRIALEGITAANTASRSDAPLVADLDALLGRMKAALDDQKSFAALDLEFHLMLARKAGNFLIVDLVAIIRSQLEHTMSRVLLLPNARPLSLKEHVAIVDAVRRNDPDGARQAMQTHLDKAVKRYQHAVQSRDKTLHGKAATKKVSRGAEKASPSS